MQLLPHYLRVPSLAACRPCLILIVVTCLLLQPRTGGAQEEEVSTDWMVDDTPYEVVDEGPVATLFTRVLVYPYNRILDLVDIFHLDIGFGLGMHANVHATRMLQLGAGASATSRLGLDGRQIGNYSEQRAEVSILPFSMETYSRDPSVAGNFRDFNTATEREQLYESSRDYFGVGGAFTVIFISVQGEFRPSAVGDFVVGLAGFDPQGDDRPINFTRDKILRFSDIERDSIQKMVLVTSRVTKSPRVGSEKGDADGVAVYYNRAKGDYWFGKLGQWAGRNEDADSEIYINDGLASIGYDLEEDLAERFEEAYRRNTTRTDIVAVSNWSGGEDLRVSKKVADEIVWRLPNYKELCEAYEADVVCDLRILEWSVFQSSPGSGLRVRLNVECKIIDPYKNEVMVDISKIVYDVEKQTDTNIEQFGANGSRLVQIETQQALEILVPQFIDRLFER